MRQKACAHPNARDKRDVFALPSAVLLLTTPYELNIWPAGLRRRHHICTTSHPHKVHECHIWGWNDFNIQDKAKGKKTINLPEFPVLSGSLCTDILIKVALAGNKSEQWKESGSYIYRLLSWLADHRLTKRTKNDSVTLCHISLWIIRFPQASAWMTPSVEELSCIGGQETIQLSSVEPTRLRHTEASRRDLSWKTLFKDLRRVPFISPVFLKKFIYFFLHILIGDMGHPERQRVLCKYITGVRLKGFFFPQMLERI